MNDQQNKDSEAKECEMLKRCIFFNDEMSDMPAISELLKEKYCRGSNADCARHMVFRTLGSGKVPSNLFPHDVARAESIINNPEEE